MGEVKKIKVIGIGPGAPEYVLPVAREKARECELLIGSKRALALFPECRSNSIGVGYNWHKLLSILQTEPAREKGVVVAGDPGFYSLLSFLRTHFGGEMLEVIPGISSFQYLFAKMALAWQDYHLISFHGRVMIDLPTLLGQYPKVVLLTDVVNNPQRICAGLLETVYENCTVIVGEMLSYPEEKITVGTVKEIAQAAGFQMSVMVIDHGN